MWLPHPADGSLLANRGLTSPSDFYDPHGIVGRHGLCVLVGVSDWSSLVGSDVNQGCCCQLSELHQLHVFWRTDHGHCRGALRPSYQGSSQNNKDGEDISQLNLDFVSIFR